MFIFIEYASFFFLQRETRRVYNLLLQEEENPFEGWKIMPGYEYVTNNYFDIIMIDFVYIVQRSPQSRSGQHYNQRSKGSKHSIFDSAHQR